MKPMNPRYMKVFLSPPLVLSGLVLVLWFSWQAILGFLLHALILLAEVLELLFDHLLEDVLRLEGHSAQMWTAWTGFLAFVTLGFLGYRAARRRLVAKFATWDKFIYCSGVWAREHWLTLAMPLAVLVTVRVVF